MINVTAGLAFLAGFLSFVSPCVLPLIPAYVTYMGNRITAQIIITSGLGGDKLPTAQTIHKHRFQMTLHGIAFVVGFMFVFVVFGLAVTAGTRLLSSAFYEVQREIIPRAGGVLIILFGLHFMGLIVPALHRLECWSALERMGQIGIYIKRGAAWLQSVLYADTRPQMRGRRDYGLFGSSVMGVIFAAGWTPCIGPIYGTILTMAIGGTILQAGGLMVMYSLGLGIPFIITAMALDRTQGLLRQFKRHMNRLKLASGILLIGIGILVFTGNLQRISQFGAANALFSYKLEECTVSVSSGQLPMSGLADCLAKQ